MGEKKHLALNAALNLIRQLCAVIFPIITFPYASRILGTDNYGKVEFGLSVVNMIALIASLGIAGYAIREGARIRDDKRRISTFVNEVFSLNLLSMTAAYMILAALLVFWPKLTSYRVIIFVLCLSIAATTIGADWINSIYEDFLFITVRYIICQTVAVVVLFLIVHGSEDYVQYAFTTVLGGLIANFLNVIHIRKKWGLKRRLTTQGIRKHLEPVFILFGNSLSSLVYINSDVMLLGIFAADSNVGIYTAAGKIYTLVKQLVSAAMIVVIPSVAGSIGRNEDVREKLNGVLQVVLLLLGPAAAGLFVLRKEIVLLLSGNQYLPAEKPLAILAAALIFAVLACFFANVIMIPFRMEKKVLLLTTVSAAVNIVLNIALIPQFKEQAAAGTTLISEIIMLAGSMWYTKEVFRPAALKTLLTGAGGAAVVFAVYALTSRLTDMNLLRIALTIALTLAGYGAIVLVLYRELVRSFAGQLRRRSKK